MRSAVFAGAAWVFALSGVTALGWSFTTDVAPAGAPAVLATEPAAPGSADARRARTVGDSAMLQRNLFRPQRRPAEVAYDPVSQQQPTQRTPALTLALVGIIGGAKPAALIRGFTGIDGAQVLAVGDETAGYRLVRLLGASALLVRVSQGDTLTLTLRDHP